MCDVEKTGAGRALQQGGARGRGVAGREQERGGRPGTVFPSVHARAACRVWQELGAERAGAWHAPWEAHKFFLTFVCNVLFKISSQSDFNYCVIHFWFLHETTKERTTQNNGMSR